PNGELAQADARRRPATIVQVRWLIGRRPATARDCQISPEKAEGRQFDPAPDHQLRALSGIGSRSGSRKESYGSGLADNTARRRGHAEDPIYFDAAKNRYVGRSRSASGRAGSGSGAGSQGAPCRPMRARIADQGWVIVAQARWLGGARI